MRPVVIALSTRVVNVTLTGGVHRASMTETPPPEPIAGHDTATLLGGTTVPMLRVGLFGAWLVLVAYLAVHHVFWRDEVRAFSLALTGDDVVAMARAVHGEGHPLLWYLMLRGAHALVPVREVLPAVGLAVGIAGAAFFAWRAPFRPLVIGAVLFGGWMAFEYVVMARNYGISMLLMFVIADRFARRRDGVWTTGGLLFLLCNTNVPSVILAGGFLLFRLVEIVLADGWRWRPALRRWLGTALIGLAGVVVCFLTVYPPFNDAAVSPLAGQLSPGVIAGAAVNIGPAMQYLWPQPWWRVPGAGAIIALLVLAAPFSLLRSPAGVVAGLVVLPMLPLFFYFVYPGGYRHQALYLAFLLALHWMVASGRGGRWGALRPARRWPLPIATALFLTLLGVQAATTVSLLVDTAQGRVAGQSAALGRLLARPELARAIVLADPEVLMEAVPYYAPNPIYLLRRQRFGTVAHLTRHADQHLTIGGILATAQRLHKVTGRPVVLLMQYRLDRRTGWRRWTEGPLGDVVARPGEMAAFLDATRPVALPISLLRYGSFDAAYDVYVLPRVTGS